MAAVLAALSLLVACDGEPAPAPSEPSTFQTAVSPQPEASTALTDGEEGDALLHKDLLYRADVREAAVTEGETILLQLRFSVPALEGLPAATAYYQDWLNDREYVTLLEEEYARERYQEALEKGGIFFPFAYESDFTIVRNDGVLFSVLRDFYENTGGARPAYRLMAESFIVEDGAMLILEDVFTVDAPQYQVAIRDAVLALLPEKIAEMGQDPYYENIADMMIEVFDSRDFCLTVDSLIVFWQTASIAPAIAGVQQFDIPLEQLRDIVDPRWLP